MELQTGTPAKDGRYIVWTPCASRQIPDWCEPHIATWTGGRWIFYRPIVAWQGPLPTVNAKILEKLEPASETSYDL